jgi:hypothetical protein
MPKLTAQLRAGLVLLAGVMPEQKELVGERATGAQILADNPLARLKGGLPLDPKQTYRRMVAKGPVNHARRIVRAYETGGRAGVLAYCKPHIEPENFALFSAKLSELVPA